MGPTVGSFGRRRALLATGGAGVVVGAAYLAAAWRLPLGALDSPGAGVFPIVVGAVLVVASLLTIAEGTREPAATPLELPDRAGAWRVLRLLGLLAIYLLAVPWIGFPAATFVFCATTIRLLGDASWAYCAAWALAITVVLSVVFITLLGIPLPFGALWR